MPELPEVTTTVNGLQRTIVSAKILDVWTDLAKIKVTRPDFLETVKYLPYFKKFKKIVSGTKVVSVERRAKNILINLSNAHTILIHMKMTGHIMVGQYEYNKKQNKWLPHKDQKNEALHDPYNRFIHVVFVLENNNKKYSHFVFCDSRKFGTVKIVPTKTIHETYFSDIGPEPLDKDFTYEKFVHALRTAPAPNRPIKIFLMDPRTISGIGNIYSDEMLWLAGIHPLSVLSKIPKNKLKVLFTAMKKVLQTGIDFGGDSMSDYRDVDGKPGRFQNKHNAYRKTKNKCSKRGCKGIIVKATITGRSAHFCNVHQVLYN